jgi:hypothetical protein
LAAWTPQRHPRNGPLIDPSGRHQEAITVSNTVAEHGQLVEWLTARGSVERLGIEGAGGYGCAVALVLLTARIPIVEGHQC